jgi:hypothetical protein
MTEAPSNKWAVNQAALTWLQKADAAPDPSVSYLAQLAWWGLERGGVTVKRPIAPSQPEPHDLENAIGMRLGSGAREAAQASRWFLSNPNLSFEEQAGNLEMQLREAEDPQDAARAVIETAYDLMVAESPTHPD